MIFKKSRIISLKYYNTKSINQCKKIIVIDIYIYLILLY